MNKCSKFSYEDIYQCGEAWFQNKINFKYSKRERNLCGIKVCENILDYS